jgi:ribonuclease T2
MTSSKGDCGVSGGEFSCGSGVKSTTFSAVSIQAQVHVFYKHSQYDPYQVSSGGALILTSGGSTSWSSDGVPSGQTVFDVFTGSSHSQGYTLEIVGV